MNLYPYQVEGAQWLASRKRAILGDMMGLGKTPQAITAADLLGAKRVAVACPAIGRSNWKREFDRWSLLGPELYIESYTKLATDPDARKRWREFRPQIAVCDEFHMMKSRDAKATRYMYGSHCHNTGLLSIPQRVWLLSGTPTPNNIGELWTHLRALWPELIRRNGEPLGYVKFLSEFADWKPTDFGPQVLGNKREAIPELRRILKQIMLRRKSDTVLDLPPLVWQDTTLVDVEEINAEVELLENNPEVETLRRVLEASVDKATRELTIAEDAIALASLRRHTAVLKAGPVADLIAEELICNAYPKIVIFAHHKAAIDILATKLARFEPVVIRGGQTDARRQGEIDRFQSSGSARVAIVQQKAGYHTITLTAANQVAFLEQSWTPDENVQAAKRCHRIGQTRPVFVRNFGLPDSIDEAVQQVLSRKAKATLELYGDK